MTDTTIDPLAYYAKHGAALFPVPHGAKNPTGIVKSFVEDCSNDPAQWERWRAEHGPKINFGLMAGASRVVVVDIDSADYGRDEAWAAYCKLCASWGLATPPQPQVQSARGGWHSLFRVPDNVDSRSLRGPDALKGIINVKAGNGFVIAAGSYYDGTAKGEASGSYVLLNDAPPHPAPAALIEHCTRNTAVGPVTKTGTHEPADVAALLRWMAEARMFTEYSDWTDCGMALRLEFGDAGLDLWRLTHLDDGKDKNEASHWQSFSTDPRAGMVTLNSLFDKAHKAGWTGSVRQSLESMFGASVAPTTASTVASIAANAGATLLSSGAPGPDGKSMFGRDEAQANIGEPYLTSFFGASAGAPFSPRFSDFVLLPVECASKKLYAQVNDAIPRLLAACEAGMVDKETIKDVLAVIWMTHEATGDAITRLVRTKLQVKITEDLIRRRGRGFKARAEDTLIKKDDFIRDPRTAMVESDNADNLAIFYGMIGLEIRYNEWLNIVEVLGWQYKKWTKFDDRVERKIRMHASKTSTGYKLRKEFHWDAADALASENPVDPAIDYIAECEKEWDGFQRLHMWLSMSCGVPCDHYHQMVGRSIIGGMVKRIREPGSKHDEMAVFVSEKQGTGKSTLGRAICPDQDWFSEGVKLGDEGKNLIPKLRGKAVCEISEMGTRGQIEDVKAMLSTQVDSTVLRYERTSTDHSRRNIFVGSTNKIKFLIDDTGNRRFLPIVMPEGKEIDIEWIERNKRQMIGEAAALHTKGEKFRVPRDLWSVAGERQEAARVESSEEILFGEWFAPNDHDTVFVLGADVERLGLAAGFKSPASRGQIMRKLGFVHVKKRVLGEEKWIWQRGREILPRHYESHAFQYIVDTSTADRFPKVTLRRPQAPPSIGTPGGPPMPPSIPTA